MQQDSNPLKLDLDPTHPVINLNAPLPVSVNADNYPPRTNPIKKGDLIVARNVNYTLHCGITYGLTMHYLVNVPGVVKTVALNIERAVVFMPSINMNVFVDLNTHEATSKLFTDFELKYRVLHLVQKYEREKRRQTIKVPTIPSFVRRPPILPPTPTRAIFKVNPPPLVRTTRLYCHETLADDDKFDLQFIDETTKFINNKND